MAAVIFLVDDDDGSRDAMTRTLERVGYTLRSFPSAEEALERLREGDEVDAVVSDVRMPGMDGYQFLREVRAVNMVMVGAASHLLPLPEDCYLDALRARLPERIVEVNAKAFQAGRALMAPRGAVR